MSTEDANIDVNLVCKRMGCDNIENLAHSNMQKTGVYQFNPDSRYICMRCGSDMELCIEKITYREIVEAVK